MIIGLTYTHPKSKLFQNYKPITMNTEQIIAFYFGAGAVTIGIFYALFKYMQSLVDKDCPLDNCPECGEITYQGTCDNGCHNSGKRIDHSVQVKRMPMDKWMMLYNKSFPCQEIKYCKP